MKWRRDGGDGREDGWEQEIPLKKWLGWCKWWKKLPLSLSLLLSLLLPSSSTSSPLFESLLTSSIDRPFPQCSFFLLFLPFSHCAILSSSSFSPVLQSSSSFIFFLKLPEPYCTVLFCTVSSSFSIRIYPPFNISKRCQNRQLTSHTEHIEERNSLFFLHPSLSLIRHGKRLQCEKSVFICFTDTYAKSIQLLRLLKRKRAIRCKTRKRGATCRKGNISRDSNESCWLVVREGSSSKLIIAPIAIAVAIWLKKQDCTVASLSLLTENDVTIN